MTLVLRREPNDKASFEISRWIEAGLAAGVPASARPDHKEGRDVPGPTDAVDISFVVPVRDAEATLIELYQRIVAALPGDMTFEVLLIDDGSRDRSWEVIGIMARCEPATVRGLRFQSHAGLAPALATGFRVARGKIIFTLSADLQDDLSEVGRLLDKLGEGYDLVSGSIKDRHDPLARVFPIRIFTQMLGMISGVLRPDHWCGLKCLRAEAARKLMLTGEPHELPRALPAIDGLRVAEVKIDVHRHLRRSGVSKSRSMRSLRGFIDTVTAGFLKKHRERSVHLVGGFSAYHCVAAVTLVVGGVTLAAVQSLTAAWVAVLSAVLLLGPALHDSTGRRFRELSLPAGQRSDRRPLIIEDTAGGRNKRKGRSSSRSTLRSQTES
jgi:dolichol-phosphate mannosyltransferase